VEVEAEVEAEVEVEELEWEVGRAEELLGWYQVGVVDIRSGGRCG
jgi:hypothetical protein